MATKKNAKKKKPTSKKIVAKKKVAKKKITRTKPRASTKKTATKKRVAKKTTRKKPAVKKAPARKVKKTTTTRPPNVPLVLIELGRLVELQTDIHKWKWTKKEDWIVASSESGKRLYLFPRPKKQTTVEGTTYAKEGAKLYKIFNHRKHDKLLKGNIHELKRREGRAINIIYHSDKFGRASNYIHSFDRPPIVWVNNNKNPKIVALTGGDIRINTRGIEG